MYATFTHPQVQEFVKDVLGNSTQDEFGFFPEGKSRFHFRNKNDAHRAAQWFDRMAIAYRINDVAGSSKAVIEISGLGTKRLMEMATDWGTHQVVEPFLRQCLKYKEGQTFVSENGTLRINCAYDPELELRLYNAMRKGVDCGLLPNLALDRTSGIISISNVDLLKALERLGSDKAREAYLTIGQRPSADSNIWSAVVAAGEGQLKPLPEGHAKRGELTYHGTLAALQQEQDEARRLANIERGHGGAPGSGKSGKGKS